MTNPSKDIEGKVREAIKELEPIILDHKDGRHRFIYSEEIRALQTLIDFAILSLTTKAGLGYCDVCWTSSWMTVPKDTPNAQQVTGKDEWVLCQMCEADRNIIKLTNKAELVPLDEKEVEKVIRIMPSYCYAKQLAHAICSHFSKPSMEDKPFSKEPLSFNCTLAKFAEQLNVPLWKAMEFGKYFKPSVKDEK